MRRIEHGGNEPISVVPDVEHQGLANLVRIGKGTSNILDVAPPYGCRSLKPCHRLAGNVRRFPLEEQIQSALADHVHKHMLAFRAHKYKHFAYILFSRRAEFLPLPLQPLDHARKP